MRKKLKCPMKDCKSDRVLPRSSQEEFNENLEIYICCRCMCRFKADGTIVKEGDRAKFDKLEKERLLPKKRKRKRKVKKKKK